MEFQKTETENRRRDTSGRAHTTTAEGLEGRKERYLPTGWQKGYLVKLPKKSDLSLCKNWRGIMLHPVHPKQNIMQHHPGETKHCSAFKITTGTGWLAGFRTNESCAHPISTSSTLKRPSAALTGK
ncbi:unnamed protein product [Heterobilharzia americana]|nr:unnamed protein product [Heterobilharzia americana]CAH8460991.1 unnamed protein product [Heterobilharzia americana]